MYALNSESNVSSVPDVVMSAVTSTLAPSGQANSGSAAASAADHANGEVAGGGAPGAHATTPANAVVNAAWRSAEAGQAQVEGGEIEGGDNGELNILRYCLRFGVPLDIAPPRLTRKCEGYVCSIRSRVGPRYGTATRRRHHPTSRYAFDSLAIAQPFLRTCSGESAPAHACERG